MLFCDRERLHVCSFLTEQADKLRVCAAAAADKAGACRDHLGHDVGEFLRTDVEHRFAVDAAGHTGIGLDQNRETGAGDQTADYRHHLFRAKRAVGAERIYAESLQHGDHGLRRCAGHEFGGFVVGVAHKDRKAAILLCGKHGRLGFIAVVHGLDKNQIGAGGGARPHGFGKDGDRLFEGQVAERLEDSSERADIEGDKAGNVVGIGSGLSPLLGAVYCGLHDLCNRRQAVEPRVFQTVCAEGIGQDQIAPVFKVDPVQTDDPVGVPEIPEFRQLARLKPEGLKNRSGSPVEIDQVVLGVFQNVHGCIPP